MERDDANKRDDARKLVLEFYEIFVNQRDFDAAVGYLGESYVQHRADIRNDVDSLREFTAGMKQRLPQLRAEVRRVFVDGEFVILHPHVVPEPDALGSAHVDIFRVVDGKIVEHWDVDEPTPEHRAHNNPIVWSRLSLGR